MRMVIAVSAMLVAALLAGSASADCDECRSRDRPNPARALKERIESARPARVQLHDARPQRERPSILNEKPGNVLADKRVNPKEASTVGAPRSYVTSSDRFVRQNPSAAKTDNRTAKNMMAAHIAEKGGKGGRPDIEAPMPGKAPKAVTAGFRLKVLEIVRPANARPIITPAGQGAQGCSTSGKCINGDPPRAAGTPPTPGLTYTPDFIGQSRNAQTVKGDLANRQRSSLANPSTSPLPNTPVVVQQRRATPPVQKARKDTINLAPASDKSRPDDR